MIDFSKKVNELIAHEDEKIRRLHQQAMGHTTQIDFPTVGLGDDISELLANSKEQNRLLIEQNQLLREENERQKQQLIEEKQEKENAQKLARNARIFSWISFGVTTIISIASFLVTILIR